ncbi:MAG: TRAP transporter substrate-binding protein [Alphaproteobacteria bacterium]|nr:TRAP transporter substrate-binding protein [Alphaproteobacteria bacterium]
MKRRFSAVAAALVVAGAWASAAVAQGAIEFRYTTGAPPKTPWVMQLDRFAKDLEEESKGTMKIQSFINAQLGNEQDTMQQVARGRIDMGGFSTAAAAALVPELSLLNMPLYFDNAQQQDCVHDRYMTNVAKGMLAQRGVVFLGWTHVGAVDVVGKRPFLLPSDIKGLKARSAPTKTDAAFWRALGANPNPLGITEWASAHQTGLVDVSAAPITYYFPSGLGKVAPVMTRTNHVDASGVVVMAKSRYDRLSTDQRNILERTITKRPASQLRAEIRGFEDVIRGMHVKSGGQIVPLTAEQRAAWRKAVEAVWPEIVKAVGGDAPRIWKIIEDGKKACGGTNA